MSGLHKKIELLANVAIILVALLLGGVLVKRYLWPGAGPPQAAAPERIKPGTKLSLPGVDWGRSRQTLLLVLSTTCRFCTESAPFYQRLAREKAGRTDVRLLASLPQTADESRKYLGEHGIAVDQVTQSAPSTAYARATPTLILVDQSGTVIDSWVGKLPPPQEEEVSNRLFGGSRGG